MKFGRYILTLALVCSFSSSALALNTGALAPDFTLDTHDGQTVTLSDFRGQVVVLEWFNKGCPFVQKHYRPGQMQALQNRFAEKGVVWLTVNSTNSGHKDFLTPGRVGQVVEKWKIENAKMLSDPSGEVGKLYGAKTTPHMFIIDEQGKLIYQGAIDDDSAVFADPKEAKNYVAGALEQHFAGKQVSPSSTKPYGCSVKYSK